MSASMRRRSSATILSPLRSMPADDLADEPTLDRVGLAKDERAIRGSSGGGYRRGPNSQGGPSTPAGRSGRPRSAARRPTIERPGDDDLAVGWGVAQRARGESRPRRRVDHLDAVGGQAELHRGGLGHLGGGERPGAGRPRRPRAVAASSSAERRRASRAGPSRGAARPRGCAAEAANSSASASRSACAPATLCAPSSRTSGWRPDDLEPARASAPGRGRGRPRSASRGCRRTPRPPRAPPRRCRLGARRAAGGTRRRSGACGV